MNTSTATAEVVPGSIADYQTFKLVATLRQVPDVSKRFYHVPTARRMWTVEIAKDLRITCTCVPFQTRYQTGEGEVCEHAQEAIDFIDEVGFNRLPTWNYRRN